jgi:hypothetical protein
MAKKVEIEPVPPEPGPASLLDQRLPELPHQAQLDHQQGGRITRWEHEHVLEAVQRRLDEHPEKMRQRRETVEHPFGTIKAGLEQPTSW